MRDFLGCFFDYEVSWEVFRQRPDVVDDTHHPTTNGRRFDFTERGQRQTGGVLDGEAYRGSALVADLQDSERCRTSLPRIAVLTSYPPVRVAGDSDANLTRPGFRLLPGLPRRRVLQLAPASWKQTSEDADAQRRLAANPFRAATLALERWHPDRG